MTQRMCIATKSVRPQDELVRFVVAPDGSVVPDVRCKLPGRGVWVSAEAARVELAVRKNLFSRGFKASVQVGADIVDMVGDLLRRRALELLALAHKAGLVRAGYGKIIERAGLGALALLAHASDASVDGVQKLHSKISAARGARTIVPTVNCFSSAELSLALGRSNVVHAALIEARLTEDFATAARKYETYVGGMSCSPASA
jgi:hypothetical protein